MIMSKNLFNIFTEREGKTQIDLPTTNTNTAFLPAPNRQEGEAYHSFGKRACMYTNGSPLSLRSYLQRIFQSEKTAQLRDQDLQQSQKREITEKISETDQTITKLNNEIAKHNIDIRSNEEKISSLEVERQDLISSEGEANKLALVKFYFGLLILVILTTYLFIFYSSTFSSAFIKGPENIEQAMFNPNALLDAFHEGTLKGMFLITVPIIFLGLGYGLHYFNEQKSNMKYFKVGFLVVITFLFDGILAVKIAKSLHDLEATEMLITPPPFTIGTALSDINVWAVIFCGFIVYMIWAIVFDMTITAYGECRSNKGRIRSIGVEIESIRKSINELSKSNEDISGEIEKLKAKKDLLTKQLTQPIYTISVIKQAFAEFYNGWNSIIAAVGLPTIDACAEAYKNESNNLLNDLNLEEV